MGRLIRYGRPSRTRLHHAGYRHGACWNEDMDHVEQQLIHCSFQVHDRDLDSTLKICNCDVSEETMTPLSEVGSWRNCCAHSLVPIATRVLHLSHFHKRELRRLSAKIPKLTFSIEGVQFGRAVSEALLDATLTRDRQQHYGLILRKR